MGANILKLILIRNLITFLFYFYFTMRANMFSNFTFVYTFQKMKLIVVFSNIIDYFCFVYIYILSNSYK